MTPDEVAEVAGDALQQNLGEVREITTLYRNIRYAPTAPPLDDLKQAVNDFRPVKQAR